MATLICASVCYCYIAAAAAAAGQCMRKPHTDPQSDTSKRLLMRMVMGKWKERGAHKDGSVHREVQGKSSVNAKKEKGGLIPM